MNFIHMVSGKKRELTLPVPVRQKKVKVCLLGFVGHIVDDFGYFFAGKCCFSAFGWHHANFSLETISGMGDKNRNSLRDTGSPCSFVSGFRSAHHT